MESPMGQESLALPTTPNSSEEWSRRSNRIRVTRACDRCKKRKVRCSGRQPCQVCVLASATCSYNASYTRGRRPATRVTQVGASAEIAANPQTFHGESHRNKVNNRMNGTTIRNPEGLEQPQGSVAQQDESMPLTEPISRASPQPTQIDLQGHYVGPSSGISFLSRVQARLDQSVSFPRGLSAFNFGDAPLLNHDAGLNPGDIPSTYLDPTFPLLLNRDDTSRLVQRYFDFAVPVDRFLHRPTIEKWYNEFYETHGVMYDKSSAPTQTAVLFMIFAISQEHTVPKSPSVGAEMSVRYFRAASHQLSKEQGSVRLASIQVRLCQCLWFLSQSRINHCWSLFGTIARLIFALGLHRNRHAFSNSMTQVEIECRRRTFWSAYSLDNYLSMALGRPRTFNDKDIDQELPSCVDDDDVHGNIDRSAPSCGRGLSVMFGPINYARLCRVLSGILGDVYSIQPMSITERLAHTKKYMKDLKAWRMDMYGFLDQASSNAAPVVLIYQRQQNVLNLAYWHTIILTNRPLLLTNFARLTNSTRRWDEGGQERKAHIEERISDCLHAAMEITGIVDMMTQAKQLLRAFWFTPYFAFSASVILYVYTIQHSKESDDVYRSYFSAAERCQHQIADVAEEGSLTSRYCVVLEELRAEAVRQISPVETSEHPSTQVYPTMDTRGRDIDTFATNIGDMSAEFAISSPDVAAMGPLEDLHVSPGDSLEDLTGWGNFDSMVVSGFNSVYHFN
ncbi:putative transcriptional activator protein acu-15 [Aspergillus steynii IBT 23096]|uniref:Putative transcriptional activator protein acu-15 n=1 Tax=Aspergillus steynii IBT 23096 TaxID=1392250 RepID=A0A2I2G8Y2_9EURO|nr:putative transcriptional activator protein acu-15 [Aspergillus steynii IBT 23096]PLB49339.1 putative transcriptional activator protein acu-15 [Aspergillus steynii IBT 23096]